MTQQPTPDELLCLARKVFPWMSPHVKTLYHLIRLAKHAEHHPRFAAALHAALLVLAGDLDVAALMTERDFYRNEVIAYERAASFAPPRDTEENL